MSDTLPFTVWRDSVCAGDDGDAPHEIILTLLPDATLRATVERCLQHGYLASIAGGRATWILEARRVLAVIAQEWDQPRFLVSPDAPVSSLVSFTAKPQMQFKYLCQADPGKVFAQLQREQNLPTEHHLG